MANTLLETIHQYLSEEGMDSAFFDESEEHPIPRLLVYLGVDHNNLERILEITAEEQALPANFKTFEEMRMESGYYRLQIQSLIPIDYHSNQGSNIASVINFINGMLELPGIILDEAHDRVFYRTVQLVHENHFDKILLIGIVGMHRMVLDIFTDLLEKIATGQMSYLEFLDEIVKHTHLK